MALPIMRNTIPLEVSVIITVMSFDDLGIITATQRVNKNDMFCIVQQMMAEKKGWA